MIAFIIKHSFSCISTQVNRDEVAPPQSKRSMLVNQYSIALNEELQTTDSKSLLKSCETLAFLVRDAAHVTPHNFESCVHTIRTFVEASLNGGKGLVTKSFYRIVKKLII